MSMTKLTQHYNTRKTPQSQAIPGSTQVKNSAGGFSWAVDDFTRLDRFLILGTEGGSYYAGEKKLTVENAEKAVWMIRLAAVQAGMSGAAAAPSLSATMASNALLGVLGS